jgi:hypothetical protein
MSIKIIGGPEIKTHQPAPPVTPLVLDINDDDDYDNYDEFDDEDGSESDITMNNVYFAIVITLLLMILYHLTGVKGMLNDVFSE